MFRRIRFRVGTVLAITAIVAVLTAWRVDHNRLVRAPETELEKFQGTWILFSREAGGQVIRTSDDASTMAFAGNKWVSKLAETVVQAGTFTLVDVAKAPKRFNFTSTEGGNATGYAIFEFDGDTFKYCANDAGDEARPTNFTTKIGDGRYCMTWKKAKK